MHKVFLIAAVITAFSGCSAGKFSHERNHFLSVYGIKLADCDSCASGFIGRAVHPSGNPVANAQVYVKDSRNVSLTNDKGGFYLPNLSAGSHEIFVVQNDIIGARKVITVRGSELAQDAMIELYPMMTVSGVVKTEAFPVSQATVSVEGTPFETATDERGEFALKLPEGVYNLTARHMLYEPKIVSDFQLEGTDTDQLEVVLSPLMFPKGSVVVDSGDGFMVRGSTTKIKIIPSDGVTFMRVIEANDQAINSSLSQIYDQWLPVSRTMELNHRLDGFSHFSIVFSDAFGKISEPVRVSYYNTSYPSDWRIIYGFQQQPVRIHASEKVAIINAGSPYDVKISVLLDGSHPAQAIRRQPPNTNTLFAAPLIIEAGATVHGAPILLDELTAIGTPDAPITWDIRGINEDEVDFNISPQSALIRYVILRNGYINLPGNFLHGDVLIQNTVFDRIDLRFNPIYLRRETNQSFSEVIMANLTFLNSHLEVDCPDKFPEEDAESPLKEDSEASLIFRHNHLERSSIHWQCVISDSEAETTLPLPAKMASPFDTILFDQNNFGDLEDSQLYFDLKFDEPDTGINAGFTENYFAYPNQAYPDQRPGAWPEALGTRLSTPISGVGAGFDIP